MPGRLSRTIGIAVLVAVSACEPSDTDRLLVTSGFTDQVFVLDARSGAVLDSVRMDRRPGERDEPHGIAIAPDGGHWYATLSHGEPSVWKYASRGHRLVGRLTLPTRGASRVRLSPDGALAAIPDYWLGGQGEVSQLAVVRTHDLSLVGAPDVCPAPHDAAFSPDGNLIAVTCVLGSEVVLLDASTLSTFGRYDLGGEGTRPMNVAWRPAGEGFFVSLMGRGGVVAVDRGSGPGARIPTGARPAQIALTPDGAILVVANRGDSTVALVRVDDGEVRRVEIPGAHPHGVALDPVGETAFVTYEGDVESRGGVVAVDLEDGVVLWHTIVGLFTLGVAYLPAR